MVRACLVALLFSAAAVGRVIAADPASLPAPATRDVEFIRDIQPIFREHCLKCHGEDKRRGDFRLDLKSAALKGGESFAPAIIPGQSAESPLVRLVAGLVDGMQMPPEGDAKLSDNQIGLLRAWIDQGAKWPEDSQKEDGNLKHWSFQPVIRPTVPVDSHVLRDWSRSPIDSFVAAELEAAGKSKPGVAVEGLRPSVEADRTTLLRRLKYDLIGLPATSDELAEFVGDSRPDAYERLADRLLASPHFGERWARHWLDIIKFAESDGFEMNQHRPNAWPFRDYVIRAFNEDKRNADFLFEQIAGDTVGVVEGTGFLVAGAWDRVKSPDPGLTAQQRADELHDMVSTTASAFFGLTVGCARCHNHKFDPISQTDYYSIKAVFAGVQHGERPLQPVEDERQRKLSDAIRGELALIELHLTRLEPLAIISGNGESAVPRQRVPVQRRTNVERFRPVRARFVKFLIEATSGSEPCLDELEVFEVAHDANTIPRNIALSSLGTKASSSSNLPGFPIHQLAFVNDGTYGNSSSWISNEPGRGWIMLEFVEPVEIDRILWSRDRPENGQYQDRIPTSYRIEVGMTAESMQVVASSEDRMMIGSKLTELMTPAAVSEDERQAIAALAVKRETLIRQLKNMTSVPVVYAGRFVTPEPTNRLHRGDPLQPKETILPAGLSAFGSNWQLTNDATDADRRRGLANWIISPEHPLTSRVMVNRLWQYHLGQGLVSTPSDFGRNGVPPSHPALLDWLASEERDGNSPKRLHRLIVNSATYRQSSEIRKEGMDLDASSRLLWRFAPRRLEAEPIRDAILAVCGNLDDRMLGAGFDLFEPNNNYVKVYNSKREFGPAESRRMVYQSKPRMQLDEIFGQFDCPDAGQIAPKRTSSITALQALNLLNSRFIAQQAAIFSKRLREEAGDDPTSQVVRAFSLAFLREPTASERLAAVDFMTNHGLEAFCRAILNSNEFVFVF